jgi:subtilase family serine protease
MRRRILLTFLTAAGVLSRTLLLGGTENSQAQGRPPEPVRGPHEAVCRASADLESARCHAQVRTDAVGLQPSPGAAARGGPNRGGSASPDLNYCTNATTIGDCGAYAPLSLQGAYNLGSAAATSGGGQTVAIVAAYDNPNAESDLATYRGQWGLASCTSSTGCFRKLNQRGQPRLYPAFDRGWALESALDTQMVSAICPNCKILLVEANTAGYRDLAAAVNTAAAQPGVVAINNSYGGSEFASQSSYASAYSHPGMAITVSSGDSGYGVSFPASLSTVTAVGGTSLVAGYVYNADGSVVMDANGTPSVSRGSETAWSGAGSGCSALVAKPSWQSNLQGCAKRIVADVAAVADPNTPVWVYNSTYQPPNTWWWVGGTSASAPIIAATYALAGNARSISGGSYAYSHTSSLFDVQGGSNGSCGSFLYLCTGATGYDGPTGNGTPNGAGGF